MNRIIAGFLAIYSIWIGWNNSSLIQDINKDVENLKKFDNELKPSIMEAIYSLVHHVHGRDKEQKDLIKQRTQVLSNAIEEKFRILNMSFSAISNDIGTIKFREENFLIDIKILEKDIKRVLLLKNE